MGRDKALLEFEGARLLDHQLATLREVHPPELFLSCRPGAPYDAPDTTLIFDEQEDAGPLGGIAACLDAMQSERLLVLAVDMPRMTPAFLNRLLQRFPGGVIPRIEDRYEPLAAIYPYAMLTLAHENLAKNEFALHTWVERGVHEGLVQIWDLEEKERWLFENWNEPGTRLDMPNL